MTALILSIAILLHRGTPPPAVVSAIASAAATTEEAALLTVYAAYESDYRVGVVGDGGLSCSVWQLRCYLVRRAGGDAPLVEQARIWLSIERAAGLNAVDSSPHRASRRLAIARAALAGATR